MFKRLSSLSSLEKINFALGSSLNVGRLPENDKENKDAHTCAQSGQV